MRKLYAQTPIKNKRQLHQGRLYGLNPIYKRVYASKLLPSHFGVLNLEILCSPIKRLVRRSNIRHMVMYETQSLFSSSISY